MKQTQANEHLISLVALVRDEADDLRRLLAWHRQLYDEAIVVDTGSVDESVRTARELGARVSHFTWCDDFSAARNHGLAQATGRSVLVLDCDEVIAPGDFRGIRRLAEGGSAAWNFQQRNYCRPVATAQWVAMRAADPLAPSSATGYVDVATCRLFPRHADVGYEGLVHELPNRALQRAGIPLNETDIVIHHYGHLVDNARGEIKNSRYSHLLRKKLREHPEDPQARYEMAVQLVSEGQTGLAQRLLARTATEMPEHQAVYQARLLLGRLLLIEGKNEEGLHQLETAVHDWPALRSAWLDTASVHARLGHYRQAADYLEQGRRLFPQDSSLRELADQVTAAGGD